MIWYLVGINILAFLVYGIDKYLAANNKYRVSEYNLFMFSVFGGPVGSLLGMKIFHHKTKKKIFWIFNILALFIWILVLFY